MRGGKARKGKGVRKASEGRMGREEGNELRVLRGGW